MSFNSLDLPPQPWGTRFLDLLRLLSPRTWYGLNRNIQRFPFAKNIEWECFAQGLAGLLLPMIFIIVLQQQFPLLPSNTATSDATSRMLPCYLASPWALHCVFGSMSKPIRQLALAGLQQRNLRATPLPEAVQTLRDYVAQSRAIRKRRYDIYLPPAALSTDGLNSRRPSMKKKALQQIPTPNKVPKQPHHPTAILFFPGAAVSHVSYAPIAAQLSSAGHIVVVVSMEPMRSSQPHLGADWSSIRRIMKGVERQLECQCHWVLAGHSIGSFAAMHLWSQQYHSQNKLHDKFSEATGTGTGTTAAAKAALSISSKVILWGTMYLPLFATPLQDVPIQILLVQGGQDTWLPLTEASKDEFFSHLPRVTTTRTATNRRSLLLAPSFIKPRRPRETQSHCPPHHRQSLEIITIPEGSHDGFGSYESALPTGLNLWRDRQQQLACTETLRFLAQEE